jgi:hypothetical protein
VITSPAAYGGELAVSLRAWLRAPILGGPDNPNTLR